MDLSPKIRVLARDLLAPPSRFSHPAGATLRRRAVPCTVQAHHEGADEKGKSSPSGTSGDGFAGGFAEG